MNACRRLRTAGPASTGRIATPAANGPSARAAYRTRSSGFCSATRQPTLTAAPRAASANRTATNDGDRGAPVPCRPPGAPARRPLAEPDPDQHGQHDDDRQHHELRPDERPKEAEDERGHEPRTARPSDPAREHVQDEGRVRIGDRLLHQQARIEHPGDRDRRDRGGERGQPPGVQARQQVRRHDRERHDESADQLGDVVRGDRIVEEPRRRDDRRVEDARHGAERRRSRARDRLRRAGVQRLVRKDPRRPLAPRLPAVERGRPRVSQRERRNDPAAGLHSGVCPRTTAGSRSVWRRTNEHAIPARSQPATTRSRRSRCASGSSRKRHRASAARARPRSRRPPPGSARRAPGGGASADRRR